LNAVEIEQAITDLAEQPFDAASFPYAFLEAFGNKADGLFDASIRPRSTFRTRAVKRTSAEIRHISETSSNQKNKSPTWQ